MTKIFRPKSFIPSNSIFKEEQDQTKTIEQRALEFFSDIIGLKQVKINVYRALISEGKGLNVLLLGAPSTAKTMILEIIERKCNNVIYYDASSGSTRAGLVELLRLNPKAKIVLVDEIMQLKSTELGIFRSLLGNSRRINITQKSRPLDIRMSTQLKVIATTNNGQKLSTDLPLKSRFQIYLIKPYDNEEFVEVMKFSLERENIANGDLALELSYAFLKYNIKIIRKALNIAALIHKDDDINTIADIIENYIINSGEDCSINFNETE